MSGGTVTLSGFQIASNNLSLSISGNTAGATSLLSSGTGVLVGGNNITLSQNGQSISLIAGTVLTSITSAVGGITSGTANTASSTAFGLVAGSGISMSQNSTSPNVTISGPTQTFLAANGISNTSGTGINNFIEYFAGTNITLAAATLTDANGFLTAQVSIAASGNALHNVSLLNGSSGALSISAGANIGIGQAGSTITISASPGGVFAAVPIATVGGGSQINIGNVELLGGSNISLSLATATSTFGQAMSVTINDTGSTLVSISSTVSGATSGTVNTASSSAFGFVAGTNITLSQNSTSPNITIIGAAGSALAGVQSLSGGGTSVTGTAVSLALSAGPFISLQSASGAGSLTLTISGSNQSVLSTITTAAGGASSGTANTASSTAFALVAGNNITLSQNSTSPNITISGPTVQSVVVITTAAGGATSGATSSISSGTLTLFAGSNITLSQSSNSLTISANVPSATNFSLNGSSSSVSLSSAGGISLGIGASSITISYSGTSNFTGLSLSGNTASSTAFSGNSLIFSAMGALSFTGSTNASGGTISMSVPTATNFSLNGSSSSVSLIAGAGISLASNASTITISNTASTLVSITTAAGGATSGTANTASSSAFGFVAGSNITISQLSTNPSITIIGPTAGAGASVLTSITSAAGGATSGTVNTASSTAFALVAGSNITLSQNSTGPNITIQGVATNTVGTVLTTIGTLAGGVTFGAINTASSSAFGVFAGSGISISQTNTNPNITILGNTIPNQGITVGTFVTAGTALDLELSAGPNISLSAAVTNGGTTHVRVTISATNLLTSVSYTNNIPLQQVAGTISSKSGTINGTNGFGSSLFLQRILVPAVMNLSEIDIAMSIGFPATNNGQGTMSRSWVLYSFGNSTSLASVTSSSGTSSWTSGTSTSGTLSSLTQFQGGWASALIQPITFASSSVKPGEYVVGQIFDFSQSNSTWTVNLYGGNANNTSVLSAATNLTSATLGALSSGGLAAVSAHTASGSAAVISLSQTSSYTHIETSGTTAFVTITAFSAGPTIANVMSSNGLSAGSFVGTSGSISAVTNVALGALSSSTVAITTLPNFGYIGTGSTTSGLPTAFVAGIGSTGAIPSAISLTNTATSNGVVVTYSGSAAFVQPWFALIGA